MPNFHPLARGYVENLLRTGLLLIDLTSDLVEDLPEEIDGEPAAEVLVDMLVGSAAPAIDAAGPEVVAAARALMSATVDRILDDLQAAADRAR